jgi:hypothetical protein
MEHDGESEQRDVDRREAAGQPARQIEIGHRPVGGSHGLSQIGQRAPESVADKDQGLGGHHAARDGGAST